MYRQQIIKNALSHVGQSKLFSFAWCARFISLVYDECGLSRFWYGGKTSLSCTNVLNWYKKNYPDQVHNNPDALRPGDIVFFNFKNNGRPNHVGIFEKPPLYTIEGNTSGESGGSEYNGNVCAEKLRKKSKIFAIVHIIFPDENPYPEPARTLSRGMKGNDVKWLQYYLNLSGFNLKCDGSFGALTEQALRRTQNALSLQVDGKCGKLTRNALKGLYEHDY